MALAEEILQAKEAADRFADADEELIGIVPTEPRRGDRVYLCAYARGHERRWLALDESASPVGERALVREAVSVAAMCELAEESAGGGDVGEVRARLVELRLSENPEGIDEAEQAAAELEGALRAPPRLASASYLDEIGFAATRLDHALGGERSPFAEAMKVGAGAAEELAAEVERTYKSELS
ncbi:MAG: hypothetical protein M3327_00300 [Actinomycetota bacterium]|nr:hypothetical protein [Actinomycetota bacterium]